MEANGSTVVSAHRLSPTSVPELETSELRRKILEMTALCKQLQDHVEYLENKMMFSGASESQTEMERHRTSHASELTRLKEKLKELVAMNVNWQKHNALQEKKLQERNERIAQLEKELATRSPGQLPESQQIEFDQLLLAKKHLCNSLEDEKSRIEEENQQLKRKVESLQLQQQGLTKTLNEVEERCQLLEAQLVMYQEDFKTERSDRERAQSRIGELEIQFADLRQQYQPHHRESSRTSRFDPYDNFGARPPYQVAFQPQEELRGRGVNLYQTDGTDDTVGRSSPRERQRDRYEGFGVSQTDGVDETDGCVEIVAEDAATWGSAADDDALSCPKCRRGFPRSRHLDLLEHMDKCE